MSAPTETRANRRARLDRSHQIHSMRESMAHTRKNAALQRGWGQDAFAADSERRADEMQSWIDARTQD